MPSKTNSSPGLAAELATRVTPFSSIYKPGVWAPSCEFDPSPSDSPPDCSSDPSAVSEVSVCSFSLPSPISMTSEPKLSSTTNSPNTPELSEVQEITIATKKERSIFFTDRKQFFTSNITQTNCKKKPHGI